MKIVNLSLCMPYNDKWGYQENLLPKWQHKIGNEVTLITTRFLNRQRDDKYDIANKETFISDDGVKVIRLDWKLNIWPCRILRIYKDLYKTLENEKPDFIFIHGCQFLDSFIVCKYLKNNKNVRAVVDNHADPTNSAKSFFPTLLHKTLWKMAANNLNKYVDKFYGVLPIRCDFLHSYYKIPLNKIELLPMGLDDDLLTDLDKNVEESKRKYNINNSYTNIVCGGKFDHYKTEVLNLIEAVNKIPSLKLYIFGSIGDEIKQQFNNLLLDRIIYVGWLSQKDSYALIKSCDIACFPGRHSVIWEQTVALGVPLIVRKWPGTTEHININNNCLFLEKGSTDEITSTLQPLLSNSYIDALKKKANIEKRLIFSYKNIAEKSII